VRDSSTMLRRNLLPARRHPSPTLNLLLTPVMLLLLFVCVFGGAMSDGAGRSAYLAHLVPGILPMTIGSTVIGTAVSVSTDMSEDVIARFRTMAIHRGPVLVGHVVGSVVRSVLSVVIVAAAGVAVGFRSSGAGALDRLAAFGPIVLFALALTWIAAGTGLVSPTAEAASNNAMPLILLPLPSSAFVPLRSIGDNWWIALVWCLCLAVLGVSGRPRSSARTRTDPLHRFPFRRAASAAAAFPGEKNGRRSTENFYAQPFECRSGATPGRSARLVDGYMHRSQEA
jgi:ABC-2 type transport system permease protein